MVECNIRAIIFAWNLSNAAALQSGAETEMEFEQLGPFTYELTTKREVLYHDVESGVLTYREYNVYNWLVGIWRHPIDQYQHLVQHSENRRCWQCD